MSNSSLPALAEVRLAVDVVIFTIKDEALQVLLIKRAGAPFDGQRALPGGFLWDTESTRQAAERILLDKAGVKDVYLEQLYTFDAPKRDPRGRVVSVAYFALVAEPELSLQAAPGSQEPQLSPADAPPKLAFDHTAILSYAHERLRSKLQYTNAAFSLLPSTFTFNQLQRTYEIVVAEQLDKRNFRKKFMSLGLIKPTGKTEGGKRHRPAELYTFVSKKLTELERWF